MALFSYGPPAMKQLKANHHNQQQMIPGTLSMPVINSVSTGGGCGPYETTILAADSPVNFSNTLSVPDKILMNNSTHLHNIPLPPTSPLLDGGDYWDKPEMMYSCTRRDGHNMLKPVPPPTVPMSTTPAKVKKTVTICDEICIRSGSPQSVSD